MSEFQTRSLLSSMAADPAPLTSVDVDRAIATAHGQRRRARWTIAAAAAVVLILTIGLVTILRPDGHDPAPVATPPVVAPTTFDASRARMEVGWLPDHLPYRRRTVTAQVESLLVAPKADYTAGIYVLLGVKGLNIETQWEGTAGETVHPVEPGPDINGTPSEWHPAPESTDGGGWLSWEWAPGAAARVTMLGRDDGPEVAARVARSIRADDEKPIALPFTATPPDGLAVAAITLTQEGDGPYTTSVEFTRKTDSTSTLQVTLVPATTRISFDPNTTLNGRPAAEAGNDTWYSLRTRTDDSALLEVKGSSQDTTPRGITALHDQCQEIAAGIRLVGDLAKPETWARTPLR